MIILGINYEHSYVQWKIVKQDHYETYIKDALFLGLLFDPPFLEGDIDFMFVVTDDGNIITHEFE